MTNLRTAAQQALEALEEYQAKGAPFWACDGAVAALRAALAEPEDDALTAAYMLGRHDSKWCPIHQHYKWCEHNGGVMGPTGWEKPVQQGCDHCNHPLYAAIKCRVCGRVTEPVQEPVWVCPDSAEHRYGKPGHCEDCGKTLVQVVEPVQEPYWYATPDGKYLSSNEVKEWMDPKTKALHLEPPQWRKEELIPLYTAPPQRKPLTEEEIDELAMDEDGLPNSHLEFARAIERAHGIGEQP